MNYKSNGKVMIIHLIVEYIKNLFLDKMSYFPEPYTHSKNNVCWLYDTTITGDEWWIQWIQERIALLSIYV